MSYVYVIKCKETNLCKIGRSIDVEARLKQIQYSSGFPCEISYVSRKLSNASKVEILAQERCSGRKVGEWFACATNMAISSVKSAVGDIGKVGSEEFADTGDLDYDHLIFWAVSGCFIKSNPIAVIKYALDTFKSDFKPEVIAICNEAYKNGSGGDLGDFVDRFDVECFFAQLLGDSETIKLPRLN